MDFVVSSFHYFFIIILLQICAFDTRFGATLSLLTEQVDFALLIFLLLLPNTIFFIFNHEENPIFYYYYYYYYCHCSRYFNIFWHRSASMCLHNIKILLFSYLFVLTLLSCLSISLTSVARGGFVWLCKVGMCAAFQGIIWHIRIRAPWWHCRQLWLSVGLDTLGTGNSLLMADNTAMGVAGKVMSDPASAPRGRVPAPRHNLGSLSRFQRVFWDEVGGAMGS